MNKIADGNLKQPRVFYLASLVSSLERSSFYIFTVF